MTRGAMLDVLLVDDPDVDPRGRAGGPRTPDGARPARTGADTTPGTGRRSGRRLLLVVGFVLALAAAGALDAGRAREGTDRLADVPGLLAPIDAPPREAWRAAGGAWGTVAADRGLVLATVLTPAGSTLTATEVATGAPLWSAAVPEVSGTRDVACVTVDTTAPPGPDDDAREDPAVATHVVCRLLTPTGRTAAGDRLGTSLLVVLDARTGVRVAERPLGSTMSTLAVAGPDLLLVELQPDGHGTVLREDPVTGSVLWSFRTSRPLPDLGAGLPVPTARVQHGLVAVDGPGAWALTSAGALLGEWYPRGTRLPPGVRRAVDLTVLPGGRFAVTDATTHDDGVRAAPSVVTAGTTGAGSTPSADAASDAPEVLTIPGRILVPVVDDGSAPDVLLTVPFGDGHVVAVDADSGRELWRAETRVGTRAVLLDRRLVVGTAGGVRALDVRSGQVRWATGPDVVPSGPDLLTDGEVVLVPVRQPDRRPALVALGITDGDERWRSPVRAGVLELRALDGRALALTAHDTVALGRDVA